MPVAYRPADHYHPYFPAEWEATDVESDSPAFLRKEGKRRGTVLSKVPPTAEVRENLVLLGEFIFNASEGLDSRGSSPEPPSPSLSPSSPLASPPLSLLPLALSSTTSLSDFTQQSTDTPSLLPILPAQPPASPGPSNDAAPTRLRRGKRTRVEDTESPCSESDLPLINKRPKRPVLVPISNDPTIASPPEQAAPKLKSRAAKATPAPLPAATPDPMPPVAASKQRRRTIRELQLAVNGKARPSTDNSHICQIGGCEEALPWQDMKWTRAHITKHFTDHYNGKGSKTFGCLRPGCPKVYQCIASAVRHFETHLKWNFPCPNAGPEKCQNGPFKRADTQKRHMLECSFRPINGATVPEPIVDGDGYAADGEIEN
ncbi:hypothetical protein GSI_12217 [Ganoderma sinense ZZ0214-1]|uniref:Uncharacterized protein n=1 Tax=Ganoderma sinense ZZ0214-1 TaxID=1077348 RepID=A0A2G8RY61_9APHY|nr:hypothetical protein GSI_12217 [Ganoderma sinense ZZ0214-1]